MVKGFSKEIYDTEKKIIEKVIISRRYVFISVLVLECCFYNDIYLFTFIKQAFLRFKNRWFCLLLDVNWKFWKVAYSVPAIFCLHFVSACENFWLLYLKQLGKG